LPQSSKYSAPGFDCKKRLNVMASKALSRPAPYPGIPDLAEIPLISELFYAE
ncbi:unnamed protein product, partial [marine sediment metagenome]